MTSKEERAALITEANELNLEFPDNVKTVKLQRMVNEAKGVFITAETPPEKPKAKPLPTHRQRIQAAKRKAMALTIVTLTNRDKRDAEVTTTAHLSFENQYFGIAKNVPLDIPVQLEAALIQIAKTTMMTLHKDEIRDGKRTGNKVPVRTAKYAVSYEQVQ